MPLTHNQFCIVNALFEEPGISQRKIAERTGLGLATVNGAMRECRDAGLVSDGCATQRGLSELEPYKVENAIVLAAGISSRFAPISYEMPKGLLKVRGEVLVERQIRQLQEAGIRHISVVVGYMKESFYYLEGKYGVQLIVNPHYADRNNAESLWLARELLGNTYICSSDDYFERNPFEQHVWKAYYSAQYAKGATDEWCLHTGPYQRITQVDMRGGQNSWCMIGHAYFDHAFSETFAQILDREHNLPETADKMWEQLYAEHVDELDMRMRRYDPPIIHEFDSLDQLRGFDPFFMENIDSKIFDHIVDVLGCKKTEIRDVYPLKQGLTNLSFHLATDAGEWVYRHPGVGTELLVDRKAEKTALETARRLGLDRTFVYEDAESGWKISRFVPGARTLDAHDDAQLKLAMEFARRLHASGAKVDRDFSFYDQGRDYERDVLEHGSIADPTWDRMSRQAEQLNALLTAERGEPVLCHNDFFGLNFLVSPDGSVDLIDWEYAGMSDYSNDFGTFAVCEQLDEEEMSRALAYYFGRKPTAREWAHNLGQVGMAGWCWYVWTLLKAAEGENVGEWSLVYYRAASTYLAKALELYAALPDGGVPVDAHGANRAR